MGESRRIETAVLVDGQRLCKDKLNRVANSYTPEVCIINENSVGVLDSSSERISVHALASGVCEVNVSVPSLDWSELVTFTIE